jgi:hypothetical protein
MKAFTYKSAFITGIFFLSTLFLSASTIYSKLSGGLWNAETTWIGEIIPGENDTAVIQGHVIVGHVVVYDIFHSYGGWVIVEPAGTLSAHEYGGGLGTFNLYVAHSIVNNGVVFNGGSAPGTHEYLHLLVNGDITNNGIWQPHQTFLSGNQNQNISLGEGRVFGGYWFATNPESITALTDICYTGGYYHDNIYYIGDFNLNDATLHINNNSINTTGTVIFNGTIAGDFEILGVFDVNKFVTDTLCFVGNVTVTDTLQSQEYGGGLGIQNLLIEGNMINNGWVRDREDTDNPDLLNLIITGNITNNGRWSCSYVSLIGTETQTITQSQGTKFVSNFNDLGASSDVVAESNLHISLDFDLNGATLDMQNYKLEMEGWLYDGFIHNGTLRGGYLQNLTSTGYLITEGLVTCDVGNVFQSELIVNDSLQSNIYGGGSIHFDLFVDGDVTNNGLIRNVLPDDMLRLNISGNITNNGEWINAETVLTGDETQYLQQSPGRFFGGNFSDADSTGQLTGNSDLTFSGSFNLGRSMLDMQANKLTMSGWLHNGYIGNCKLHGGFIQNLTSLDNLIIDGKVTVDVGNYFNANLTVNDTLQSNVYGGGAIIYYLDIDGNLTNNGVIRNVNPGHWLQINISGDLLNNGTWANYITTLDGADEQHIYLTNGLPIEGSVMFDAMQTTAPFQWNYNGVALDSPDFDGENSRLLSWAVPVSPDWYGTFYCSTGDGNSRNIIVGQTLFPASNLAANLTCTDVELSWEMQQGSPDGWNIYRNGQRIANVTEMAYADVMLMPEVEYTYYVTAVFEGEESLPTETETVMMETPENIIPQNFVAIIDLSVVNLSWAVPLACLTPDGYNVYRNGIMINTSPVLETEFSDIPGDGSFEYFVKAVYYFGESGPSASQIVEGLAIDERNAATISIYPNPVSDLINISCKTRINHLLVYNSRGLLANIVEVHAGYISLDLASFQPGIYYLVIDTDEGIIKQKIAKN